MLEKQNKYLEAAYDTLEKVSADEEKRYQYLRREVALYDQNTLMEENYERGKLMTLAELVNDGIISLAEASRRAEMTEQEFQMILEMQRQSMTLFRVSALSFCFI